MRKENASGSLSPGKILHMIVGIGIMIFGRYLPCPSLLAEPSERLLRMGLPQVDGGVLISISPSGMTALAIFAGVIYLWATVDTLWPGFLGVFVLGCSGQAPMPQVLGQFMGNPMIVMMFFLFIFAAALIRSNVSAWFARWFMTRDFVRGRPWVFTATILTGCYVVAFFEQTTSCFLIWPALYSIFREAGFKKGDLYVSLMLVYTIIMALLSFASDPVKAGAFVLISNLMSLAAGSQGIPVPEINVAAYLLFGTTISLISILCLLLLMRFVFRVDVSPLKNLDPELLRREPLPPLSRGQKIMLLLFFFYAAWLLLPGVIGADNPVGGFLRRNALGGTLAVVLLMSVIRVDGKPAADLVETNVAYPWRIFFLIAVAFLLGGAMTARDTNVNIYIEYLLRDYLSGMSAASLTVAIIVIGVVLTNFCNSVVLGLVLTPVLLAVCHAFGFAAGPVMACFIFIVLVAACTPAASPFAAMLYGNSDWISVRDAGVHSVIASLVVTLVVIAAGIPLARLLF